MDAINLFIYPIPMLNYFRIYEEFQDDELAWTTAQGPALGKCLVSFLATPSRNDYQTTQDIFAADLAALYDNKKQNELAELSPLALKRVSTNIRFSKPPWNFEAWVYYKSDVLLLIARYAETTHFQDRTFDSIAKLEEALSTSGLKFLDFPQTFSLPGYSTGDIPGAAGKGGLGATPVYGTSYVLGENDLEKFFAK